MVVDGATTVVATTDMAGLTSGLSHRSHKPAVVRSNRTPRYATPSRLAQMVERLTLNQDADGSIPSLTTGR